MDILKNEGPMAFFSGSRLKAIRAIPGGALNFLIFDYVRSKSLKEVVPVVPPSMQAEERLIRLKAIFEDKDAKDARVKSDDRSGTSGVQQSAKASTDESTKQIPLIVMQQQET